MAPGTGVSPRFFHTVGQAVCGHKLVIRISLDTVVQCHTIVSYKLIAIPYSLAVSQTPRPLHTDVDNQASRVSGLCKVGSCSVPSDPMNATIQHLVFLIAVLADADGIEIMHNS